MFLPPADLAGADGRSPWEAGLWTGSTAGTDGPSYRSASGGHSRSLCCSLKGRADMLSKGQTCPSQPLPPSSPERRVGKWKLRLPARRGPQVTGYRRMRSAPNSDAPSQGGQSPSRGTCLGNPLMGLRFLTQRQQADPTAAPPLEGKMPSRSLCYLTKLGGG